MAHRSEMLRGLFLAAAVLLIGSMLPNAAHAQASGATDVDIELPSILVLHYFSNVDIQVSGNVLQTWLGVTSDAGIASGAGAVAGTSIQTDLSIAGDGDYTPTNDPTAVPLTLLNAWAVRSLAATGESTQVTIAVNDNTLSHTGGDTITVSSGGVRVTGGGAFAGSASFSPPGLAAPQRGDVQLTLDLSNATLSGAYDDGQYTLTVNNI